jgi:hypothetical protein
MRLAPLLLVLSFFISSLGHATAPRALSASQVADAVSSYAHARGFRPEQLGVRILGLSESGKSTRALVMLGKHNVNVAINHGTMRLQSKETGELVNTLLEAHAPYKRVGLGEGSSFATKLISFRPGRGAILGKGRGALGRQRNGQSVVMQMLDAVSLGQGGSITVAPQKAFVAGQGAMVVVRENGIADAAGNIINQTPAQIVANFTDGTTKVLGFAGYKAGGDPLAIPAGKTVKSITVTDAPNAPHPGGIDLTDNAVAQARGVKGFDLVSVEFIPGT